MRSAKLLGLAAPGSRRAFDKEILRTLGEDLFSTAAAEQE
jgi:hypothetical protein